MFVVIVSGSVVVDLRANCGSNRAVFCRQLEVDLRANCDRKCVVFTDLDSYTLQRRSDVIRRIQSQIKTILRTATVIEDTIADMKKIKVSIDNLAIDVRAIIE